MDKKSQIYQCKIYDSTYLDLDSFLADLDLSRDRDLSRERDLFLLPLDLDLDRERPRRPRERDLDRRLSLERERRYLLEGEDMFYGGEWGKSLIFYLFEVFCLASMVERRVGEHTH